MRCCDGGVGGRVGGWVGRTLGTYTFRVLPGGMSWVRRWGKVGTSLLGMER